VTDIGVLERSTAVPRPRTAATPVRARTEGEEVRRDATRALSRRAGAGRELLLLLAAWVVYSAARVLADGDLHRARETGQRILELEAALGLDVEAAWSTAASTSSTLGLLSSYWYASLHYVVTAAVLVWVYRARHSAYAQVRGALVVSGLLGLVGFLLLPTAPPRLMGNPDLVDVLARYSSSGWWGDAASAPKGLGSLTNELAAMPSLHVGWAVWAAWAVWTLTSSRLVRAGAAGYAVITALVVVVTGNHYVLDVVVGAAVAALSVLAVSVGPLARGASSKSGRPSR
jgi:hypothetical protein